MDEYRIDSQKLIYHPCRVCDWIQGKHIYPIYVEISPVNHCNHRCNFCSFNFTGFKERSLLLNPLKKSLKEMSKLGVKSVMYGGEGEPLLHKYIVDIINYSKHVGLDVALTTNGVLLNEDLWNKIGESLSWVKISIDAYNPSTYAKLHGTKEKDLDTVFNNIDNMIRIKKKNKWNCTIGTQAILFPENADEMKPLAGMMKGLGADYFTIKPFTGHGYRKGFNRVDYSNIIDDMSIKFSDDDFVIFRSNTFNDLEIDRIYDTCYATKFWSYINSDGDVYSCSNFLTNKDYIYGNIYNDNLADIWKNDINIDISKCRKICRMDKINNYLHNLKHTVKHKNFI